MTIEITKPNLLVGEGREEELFFGALIKHLGLQNIQVMGIGGKTNLRQNLKALTLSPRFTEVVSLGIVRDANDNLSAAFQSVHDALQAVNLPAPGRPLVPTGDSPQVTVMILPEEDAPGMLEDLCLKSVGQDSATPCVAQYFRCLQQEGLSLPDNMSKAKVQVFLASRRKAGLRLGEAAQVGYWPWDEKAFEQAKIFLQQIASQRSA
jgi:hypothetical protein